MITKPLRMFCSLGRRLLPAFVLTWSVSTTALWGATLNVPGDFSTIQAAHDAASSGDTVLVAPGTYIGQITITKAIALASHFLPTGDESFIGTTILDGGGGPFVIEIPAGAEDRPTIQGFTIQNSKDGIKPRAMFNLFACLVRDTSDGVDYEDGSGGVVQFCTFELNGDDGIDLDFAVDIVIADNIIRNNKDDGIEIRMNPYTGPTLNSIITRNQIYNNGEDGIQLIHYDEPTDRFYEITNNLIYDNADAGIGMMNGAVTSEDFRAADIPETIYILNNAFANNSHGITGGDNTVVLNNIFVDHAAIAVKNVDANSELAFNLFFNNGTDNSGSNVDVGSSVFADPFLTASLQLPAGSPAIDAGTAFYVWQGATILDLPPSAYSGAAPDIGAFEFDTGGVPVPDSPVLVAPPDGGVDVVLRATLEWSGSGDNFTVQIATDRAFDNLVDTALVSTTQYTVAVGALDHLMTYFWRVNASNAGGTSDFSADRSFMTEAASAPPDPPTLLLPSHGAIDVPLEATLEWAGTAMDFDVEVATDAGFLSVVFSTNTASTTITLPAGPLLHETDYYWRVRGNNAFGPGGFSAAFGFTSVSPPDTMPPTQPTNLISPAQTGSTIDLLWGAATDNVGVVVYNIYRDGTLVASESDTSHTAVGLLAAALYEFQVSAIDAADNESLLSDVLRVSTLALSDPVTVQIPVITANDDAEERLSNGRMSLSSSDLELVDAGSTGQIVGMRFQNVEIPQGAAINHAYIEFETDETDSINTDLVFYGEDADDPPPFTSTSYDISNRMKTLNFATWDNVPAWDTVHEKHQTPDLSQIIQEIVDRSGWSRGNSIVVIVTGTGERTAESYNGESENAPLLVIEYATETILDTTPPSAITDLSTSNITSSSVDVTWTAPGDDGNVGTAQSYDIRYATFDITAFDWNSITEAIGEPRPQMAGTAQSMTVTDLSSNTTYYFAIRTTDDAGGISNLSNVPSATTQASPFCGDGICNGTETCSTCRDDCGSCPPDTTPPIRSNGSPTGTLLAGTTQATLALETDENAACKYSTTEGTDYEMMNNDFSPSVGTFHSSTVSGLSHGNANNYYVRCQDESGNSNTDDYTISFSIGTESAAISVRISQSTDDAEERISNGRMSLSSSDLELVNAGSTGQIVGMRFQNVEIPQGAAINYAYIEFETDETDSINTDLVFYGEDADDSPPFTSTSYDISNRMKTLNFATWDNVPAWDTVHEKHQTPDLSPIIQEIVDRSGWSRGNSIVVIVTGTGERTAESYNGESENAPLLVVEYSGNGGR